MEPEEGLSWQPVNGLVGVVGTSFFVDVAAARLGSALQARGVAWLDRQPSWCPTPGDVVVLHGGHLRPRRVQVRRPTQGWARRHRSGTHRVTLRRDDARTQLDRPINLKIGLPDRSRLFASWRWRLGPRWFSVPCL